MPKYSIDEIFKSSETKHSLGLFDKKLISSINLYDKNGKPYLKCFGSEKKQFENKEYIIAITKDTSELDISSCCGHSWGIKV